MKLPSRAHDLFNAFTLPGCPVCRLTLGSVHHYLDSLIYEYVNKPATHTAVRAARGFCPAHAWHIQEHINASALGIAVLYEGLIRTMLRDMGNVNPQGGRRQVTRAANALEPQAACPACAHQAIVEDHLIRNLIEQLAQDEFADAFRQSAGLCLPHLRQALERQGDIAAKARLIAIQQDIWTQLQRDLAEFIRKHDYRFADEAMGDEGTSPRRAIEQMAGAKDIY
jgi:hypothetical protein